MATVVLMLFAGPGTVTDGRTKRRLYASPLYNNNNNSYNDGDSY